MRDRSDWLEQLSEAVARLQNWEGQWPGVDAPGVEPAAREALVELTERLKDNYPFFHPVYAGQMLKPPHPVAWVAYAVTQLINPNNHALDGGPATAALEREVISALAEMLGYDPAANGHLGHLTASGTIANLEALFVARELHPGKPIAVAANAHYTHARMARVLGVQTVEVGVDSDGHMDLRSLERALAVQEVGTVVATLGTTGFGVVDPVHEIIPLARAHGARVHIDAAYGGFFSLLAQADPPLVEPQPFRAVGQADSIVIDPHKHGLQPYGCGAVLFAGPAVGRFYKHDSPYTYFTSADLHLGEISLECSRAGAAAAALWTTLRAIPLAPDHGLGAMLAGGRRAALAWSDAIRESPRMRLVLRPELDIVCFAPWPNESMTAEGVTNATHRIFDEAMKPGDNNVFLAKYRLDRAFASQRWPDPRVGPGRRHGASIGADEA